MLYLITGLSRNWEWCLKPEKGKKLNVDFADPTKKVAHVNVTIHINVYVAHNFCFRATKP